MHLPGEHPEYLDLLFDSCRTAGDTLYAYLQDTGRVVDIFVGNQCERFVPGNHLLRLNSGQVELHLGDRVGIVLQPGDWFTIPDQSGCPLSYECEESGSLCIIPPSALQNALRAEAFSQSFTRMLMLQTQALTLAYTSASRYGTRPDTGFRRYHAGEIIIEQDAASDQVFTLMRGCARVEKSGVNVGSIVEGDIFGVFSALVDGPYTADVVAETDVTVMSVPSSQFIQLIQAQPETFMRLLRTLSRNIQELNDRLIMELRDRGPSGTHTASS